MSSISSLLATAIAAIMPFAGSTGPVDAQDQLSQPDPAETTQTAPAEAGEQPAQDQQPGAHALRRAASPVIRKMLSTVRGKVRTRSILDSTAATCRAAS